MSIVYFEIILEINNTFLPGVVVGGGGWMKLKIGWERAENTEDPSCATFWLILQSRLTEADDEDKHMLMWSWPEVK